MRGVIGCGRRFLTAPRVREGGIIACLLVVGLLVRLPNMNGPLLAISSFRQTETAYPALIYHQQGIDLFAPQLPVLGKPWQVPFEFPLFQAMAAVIMDLGGAVDWATRVSGVICFMATAVAIWGMVRHLSTRIAAGIAVLVFLASPFNVWWSRAPMIEYMATAFSVGYVWAGMIWIDKRQRRFAALAIVLGTLAMLVKVTSAVFWMVPLLLYWGRASRPPWRQWLRDRLQVAGVLLAVPLIACVLWTHHADDVKAASPATSWLTSEALVGFNFGSVAQRLDPHQWGKIIHPFDTLVTGLPFWLFGVVCLVAILRERRAVWFGVVLAGALPVLTFIDLYAVQAYYLAAVSPAAAAVTGYALDGVLRRLPSVPLRAAAMAVIIAWLGATLYVQRDFLASSYTSPTPDPAHVLARSHRVRRTPVVAGRPVLRPPARHDARADHRDAQAAQLPAGTGIHVPLHGHATPRRVFSRRDRRAPALGMVRRCQPTPVPPGDDICRRRVGIPRGNGTAACPGRSCGLAHLRTTNAAL
jgi:4-amino-4-deoxy-L-arabinose transferase-like glycosyltransferase